MIKTKKIKIIPKPEWLRKKLFNNTLENSVKNIIQKNSLHTVCQESKCPNIGECFSNKTATFLLLGNVCTRNCQFCNISHNKEELILDQDEPERVSSAVKKMDLKYVVLTSVTRDDLGDGGASVFCETIKMIKEKSPETKIEVLVPDFQGSEESISKILECKINVFGHNLETVKRLYKKVRKEADYNRSLKVLEYAKKICSDTFIKSGIMVGLGEKKSEVKKLMRNFYSIGGDILTIGQYLPPSLKSFPINKYINPEIFEFYEKFGENIGIRSVISGPFVRSSYLSEKFLLKKKFI